MFGLGGNKPVVGLDIGSNSIKAIELRRSRGDIQAICAGLEPLSSDIVVDSMIVDSGSVASAISKIFADQGIKSTRVATSVSGHSVIVKKISMPAMTGKELDDTVRTEAPQYIPFEMTDMNLDYQVLSEESGSPNIDVLLVAVKKDKILNYTNALQLAGRQPVIVDIDAFALQNCYEFNYSPAANSTVALLNLGASVMNINIVKGQYPHVHPRRERGRKPVHRCPAEGTRSQLRRSRGLQAWQEAGTVSDDAKTPILQQVTELIVLEIQKTFDFFRATATGEHIERIYMAGGSSQVPGLIEALRREFSLPVEVLNPFLRVEAPAGAGALLETQAPQLAVAMGLALRSFEGKL